MKAALDSSRLATCVVFVVDIDSQNVRISTKIRRPQFLTIHFQTQQRFVPEMGDKKAAEADGKSRLEEIKYYTSMFLGALCIVCVFAFLFLVPFVLDPAISTLMHHFVEKPVHCRVS